MFKYCYQQQQQQQLLLPLLPRRTQCHAVKSDLFLNQQSISRAEVGDDVRTEDDGRINRVCIHHGTERPFTNVGNCYISEDQASLTI